MSKLNFMFICKDACFLFHFCHDAKVEQKIKAEDSLAIKIISSTPLLSKRAHNDILYKKTFVCAQTVDKSLASISIFLAASNLRPPLLWRFLQYIDIR